MSIYNQPLDYIEKPRTRQRPGCVTAYALLMFISAALIAIGGLLAGLVAMTGGANYGGSESLAVFAVSGVVIIVFTLGFSVLEFLLAYGLWTLKNWARILLIVLQVLGLLSNLVSVVCVGLGIYSLNSSSGYGLDPTATLCGGLVGLLINGWITWWFFSHGELFE